ncbi:MAG: glycosyltransferase family 2 protein [Candidatus Aenigmarchaeota archaeon]|nr:glycosyltransferase family 2 protein [Candidatus Aenigmarchaeota archaeon]
MLDLSIIIVNWNVKPLLERCLKSIFAFTKDINFEVFVVDNASIDGSTEMVKKGFRKRVHLIINQTNRGFSRANNQAIKLSKGKFVLLLNPDTEIKDDSLVKAVKFMEQHPRCGILGGKLTGIDGIPDKSVRRNPSLMAQIFILLKLHHLFPSLPPLKKYFWTNFNYNKLQQVKQVKGALMLIRRQVVDQIGMLDEHFFVWFEEVDYCQRTINANWEIFYVPQVKAIHYGAQSFGQIFPYKKQKMYNQSLFYYWRKYFSRWSYYCLLCFVPLNLFLARIYGWLVRLVNISKTNRI